MTAELLEEYLQYGDVEILQEKYSLLDRRPEEKVIGNMPGERNSDAGVFTAGTGTFNRKVSE